MEAIALDEMYKRIEQLCREAGVNVTTMCREAGVPRSALSDYKAGRIKSLAADKLAKIAGFLHDIGNLVNRVDHSQSGAVMAFRILDNMDCPPEEIATIVTAIGNHDEGTAFPVNAVAAAIILADKTDVRRTRVRNRDKATFDIHDRVNYSVERSEVLLDLPGRTVTLSLSINTEVCAVMDYFEIFLQRMLLSRKAAETLDLKFRLEINGQILL